MKDNQNQLNPIKIGTAMEGGFFGGIINVNGTHKGVIWAPKQAGQIKSILLPEDMMVEGADSVNNCVSNMKALIESGSPAAQKIAELNIGGFKDWLIPSRDVLELGYRHFKPTRDKNFCSWRDGENSNSVPPGWIYAEQSPAQTALEAFKEGGEDAFEPVWHWSSTVSPHDEKALIQGFTNGIQLDRALSSVFLARAVRLISISS